jgi:hypothetical protein
MQFEKAYKELLKGKKIRRKSGAFHAFAIREWRSKTYKGDYTQFL